MDKKKQLTIRHDDYDFRMPPSFYMSIHEEFVKVGLVETAVLQFTQGGRLVNFHEELISYMNNTPNWDFQIHGWGHFPYAEIEKDYIIRDLAACIHYCQKLFGKTPTMWFPPWNMVSLSMEKAAQEIGLTIDAESNDIQKFIREATTGHFDGHSVYFHAWKNDEMNVFPQMIKLAKEWEDAHNTSEI